MKILTKGLLASTLALGLSVGYTGITDISSSHHQAQAATKPYYSYKGYTTAQSKFILDKNFINALKHDNFTINGYKITKNKHNTRTNVKQYDQKFYQASTHTANGVWFDLQYGKVSEKQIIKAYGKSESKVTKTPKGKVYSYTLGNKHVQFFENQGYITYASVHNNH
ncbi:hypothetical protein N9R04_06280 [Staphylococcus sp. SQ8-PEA]|uniref:Immunodominant staphylococcal antigen B n=1 Tax=Staphylococcus marylandisciuri TaxID=2981529 RepID=A0ABT2QQU9_9STAP|nr:hypothetical protein [Staphylococcus marylandisciuri]MCU5746322.1 hypothetical protein [Staphylococcus marylandisciuri]